VAGLSLAAATNSCSRSQPRAVYVNSYHQGYGSSDAVMLGVREGLSAAGVDLQIFFLDGKRNHEALPEAAAEVMEKIRAFKPNVILVSDDDAMQHLVMPYLRAGPTPVLFCGVNWTADPYEVPNQYVTGMLEVLPVEETIQLVKAQLPDIKDLFVLSEDSPAEHKNRRFLDPIYWRSGLSTTYGLVPDFEEWKQAFRWANRNTQLVFFVTHGAIRNWDEEAAVAFIRENIRVPMFSCDEWMIRYCVVGRVKVAREPGDWLAQQALRVIQGTRAGEIPLTRNTQSRVLGNPDLAARVHFVLPAEAEIFR
jgi:ABC-type uncharacterized transport system substrate-binding protein